MFWSLQFDKVGNLVFSRRLVRNFNDRSSIWGMVQTSIEADCLYLGDFERKCRYWELSRRFVNHQWRDALGHEAGSTCIASTRYYAHRDVGVGARCAGGLTARAVWREVTKKPVHLTEKMQATGMASKVSGNHSGDVAWWFILHVRAARKLSFFFHRRGWPGYESKPGLFC